MNSKDSDRKIRDVILPVVYFAFFHANDVLAANTGHWKLEIDNLLLRQTLHAFCVHISFKQPSSGDFKS